MAKIAALDRVLSMAAIAAETAISATRAASRASMFDTSSFTNYNLLKRTRPYVAGTRIDL